MQALGERMLRIGWADSFIDDPKGFRFGWTPLGRKRLKQFYRAIRELGDGVIPEEELALLRVLAIVTAEEMGWGDER